MKTQNTQRKLAGPRITSTSAGLLIRSNTYRAAVLALFFAGATLVSTSAASADTITVTASERKPDFRITLTPAAAISGRITDPSGRPVINAEVSASRVAYAQVDGDDVVYRVESASPPTGGVAVQ